MSGTDRARLELEALDRAENAEQAGRPQIWQRQAGESAKAYNAFRIYRDLAEQRTFAKVGKELGCSSTNIERWAARWCWTQRCYEYDLVQEEEWQRQASRDRVQMRRRQIQLGQALQAVGAHSVREWQARIAGGQPLNLDPVETVAILKLGAELEGKGHGEEREGGRYTRINVIYSTLTDEVFEESCKNGGMPVQGRGMGATMTEEEIERRQWETLTPEEQAAQAVWKDPPRKLTN